MNTNVAGNAKSPLTVAQLVMEHTGALAIFTKFNIDYCCGGHRTLREACQKAGADEALVSSELTSGKPEKIGYSLRANTWSSSLLIDFIVENHHAFVRKAIPELEMLLDTVCDRHGNETPVLFELKAVFARLADELLHHMNKEEIALFPAIKRLSVGMANGPLRRIIQEPIMSMEDDHTLAGELVKQLRTLSSNYSAPDFACMTFQVTYQKLYEFEVDLMMHIHLENNILFERFKSDAAYTAEPLNEMAPL